MCVYYVTSTRAMLRDSHFVKTSIQAVQTWSNSNSMHINVRHKTEQRFIAFLMSYASCTCVWYVNRYFVTNFHCGRENVPNQYKRHVWNVWQQLTRHDLCVYHCVVTWSQATVKKNSVSCYFASRFWMTTPPVLNFSCVTWKREIWLCGDLVTGHCKKNLTVSYSFTSMLWMTTPPVLNFSCISWKREISYSIAR
jgi:hypothetical protein